MKDKHLNNFWSGFFLSAAVVLWFYWIWRQRREVLPKPITISRMPDISVEKVKGDSVANVPDSLVRIRGIGPIFENRLNEAGIYTYIQLANTDPDRLKEITGDVRWNPKDWIAQAHQLAGLE